jgi:hypothetical protein
MDTLVSLYNSPNFILARKIREDQQATVQPRAADGGSNMTILQALQEIGIVST